MIGVHYASKFFFCILQSIAILVSKFQIYKIKTNFFTKAKVDDLLELNSFGKF